MVALTLPNSAIPPSPCGPPEWSVDLAGSVRAFHAAIGVDDEVGELGSVVFAVWIDGEERFRTKVIHGGDHIHYDHANWGDATLVLDPAANGR